MTNFIVTNSGNINILLCGKMFIIAKEHANYKLIKDGLGKLSEKELHKLADIGSAMTNFSRGQVTISNGEVCFNGKTVHNALTDRILMLMREGFPFEPFVKFMENLMQNPSKGAVDELFDFLDHRGLPITEDGCFLGYKRVKENFTDVHTGTIDNSIGNVVTMPRNEVDDDRRHECSNGLHVGTQEYARDFATSGHILIVKVNPRDCVSVPKDHNFSKLRTCRYEVISEVNQEDILDNTLYNANVEERSFRRAEVKPIVEPEEEAVCYECKKVIDINDCCDCTGYCEDADDDLGYNCKYCFDDDDNCEECG